MEKSNGACRVVIAEDDPELRRMLVAALERDGYEVLEAADGYELVSVIDEAVSRDARGLPPEVVVTDLRMPGWSGLDVLTGLKRAHLSTRLILVTAFGDPRTHLAARSLGAAAVLDKPFEMDDLRAAIREALR